jgi:hypothetical protein
MSIRVRCIVCRECGWVNQYDPEDSEDLEGCEECSSYRTVLYDLYRTGEEGTTLDHGMWDMCYILWKDKEIRNRFDSWLYNGKRSELKDRYQEFYDSFEAAAMYRANEGKPIVCSFGVPGNSIRERREPFD